MEKKLFDSNIWNYVAVASDQPLRESSKPCIHNGVAIISVHLQPFVVKPSGYLPLPASLLLLAVDRFSSDVLFQLLRCRCQHVYLRIGPSDPNC